MRSHAFAALVALLIGWAASGAFAQATAQPGKDYLPQPPPITWPRDQESTSRQSGDNSQKAMRDLEMRDAASPKPVAPRRREEGPLPNRPAEWDKR